MRKRPVETVLLDTLEELRPDLRLARLLAEEDSKRERVSPRPSVPMGHQGYNIRWPQSPRTRPWTRSNWEFKHSSLPTWLRDAWYRLLFGSDKATDKKVSENYTATDGLTGGWWDDAQKEHMGWAFCKACGQDIGNAAFCPKCGANQGTAAEVEENVAGLLCYVGGWITGLVFLFVDKRPFVQFHAAQSIALNIVLILTWIVFWIPGLLTALIGFQIGFPFVFLWLLIGTPFIITWVVCMYKAYQHERFRLPFVGDIVEKMLEDRLNTPS